MKNEINNTQLLEMEMGIWNMEYKSSDDINLSKGVGKQRYKHHITPIHNYSD
jgi:uncharacterized protein YxjI